MTQNGNENQQTSSHDGTSEQARTVEGRASALAYIEHAGGRVVAGAFAPPRVQRAAAEKALAKRHRIWCRALIIAGGSVLDPLNKHKGERDISEDTTVAEVERKQVAHGSRFAILGAVAALDAEYLARAWLQDAVQAVCDGAQGRGTQLAAHNLVLMAGEDAAHAALATLETWSALDEDEQRGIVR